MILGYRNRTVAGFMLAIVIIGYFVGAIIVLGWLPVLLWSAMMARPCVAIWLTWKEDRSYRPIAKK